MSTIYGFITRHGLVSLLIVLWGIALTTWVTLRVFGDNPPDVPGGTATAFGTLFGLPTLAFGIWKWRREQK
ncbi:hypothetical protein ACEK07_46085 [Alcanivoracaceae bacterium MT1]